MKLFRDKKIKLILGMSCFLLFAVVPMTSSAAYRIETVDTSRSLYKDFVVGPGKVELEINPGESKTAMIMVTNRLDETRTFNLTVEDFTGSRNPNETIVLLGDEVGPYSLKDFVHFDSASFELKDGERALIPVTVSVPTDAQPGGLYGSVLVSTTARGGSSAQSSAIVSRLGVLFFVKVPGEVEENGSLVSFSTAGDQKLFGGGPINFDLLYENNGSVYLNPYGEVKIKNVFGQEVGSVVVDPWFSLPQSLRSREVSWNKKILFGFYTAEASINRGYSDNIDTAKVHFVVLPWKVVVGVFVGLFVIVVVIRFIVSRFEIRKKT